MSVVIETTLGDLTVDLFLQERPRACLNFLKLCKIKYYNYNLFHTISRGFIAQTGDPTGSRTGGESIYGVLDGLEKRYFQPENEPRIRHTRAGFISFVGDGEKMIGSQFFLTLGEDLTYLDDKHCVFGEVVEGFDILEMINEVICDSDDRPYQDVRITHTVVLDDPYPDSKRLQVPSRSPSPTPERLQGGRIAPDEEIDETSGKSAKEIAELQAEREAKARATILEMVGDIPDSEIAPPENVLFVCKLNPVTDDNDLEIIFSRFGKIKSCEVIRDKKSGDSLQYAFVEFEERKSCEDAYFKMDNVLIDDRRIHVDFSQSVSKIRWLGKGRVMYYDNTGKKKDRDMEDSDLGKGTYRSAKNGRGQTQPKRQDNIRKSRSPDRSRRRNSTSPFEENRLKQSSSNRKSRSRSPRKRNRSRSRSPKRKENRSRLHNKRTNRSRSRSPQKNISDPSYSRSLRSRSRSPIPCERRDRRSRARSREIVKPNSLSTYSSKKSERTRNSNTYGREESKSMRKRRRSESQEDNKKLRTHKKKNRKRSDSSESNRSTSSSKSNRSGRSSSTSRRKKKKSKQKKKK